MAYVAQYGHKTIDVYLNREELDRVIRASKSRDKLLLEFRLRWDEWSNEGDADLKVARKKPNLPVDRK